MLRTLLTPLRARFDVSPRLPPPDASGIQGDEPTPEDFARDVLVELMRNSVGELKEAESCDERMKVLAEIHKIMSQSAYTKDVFREMDGFLGLYNVLSTLRISRDLNQEQGGDKKLEGVRLVLEILSNATFEHDENAKFFKQAVGYEPLSHALQELSSEEETTLATLGFLMSFMLHDFTFTSFFKSLKDADLNAVDDIIVKYEPHLQLIHHPGAVPLFWTLYQRVSTRPSIRYGFSKMLGRLASSSYRNLAVLSSAGLVIPILEHFLSSKGDGHVPEKERHAWHKLLRRLLELGSEPAHARAILQKAVQQGDNLDPEMLDLIRYGMKSRWVDHFSMESSSSLIVTDEENKGLPASGITFMVWIFLAQLPSQGPLTLFSVSLDSKPCLTLRVRSDGRFELSTSSSRDSVILSKATLRKARWTHLTLVHYPSRSSNPSIRLFLDGIIQDGINWAYPKPDPRARVIFYTIGNGKAGKSPSWCLSSAYLLAIPIFDDLIRFIHHLGPRYIGNFQDSALIKVLTYEAATSLNMFLATMSSKKSSQADASPIIKAVRHGMDLDETQIIFSISAASVARAGITEELPAFGVVTRSVVDGDVYVVKAACFDNALWTIGGAAVVLRLVQLAQSPHELSRALSILTDGLRNNWQNSEDMERLRGYEILADVLRRKSQIINLTSFEVIFEFLGINPRTPEQSTIVNLGAYRAIALDFELWSRTHKEIQIVYLEHFTTLFETSRYKAFNITQRLSNLGLVRKLLFVLQTDWFVADIASRIIETLGVVCRADFRRDGTIKPLVSYLAANLHEDPGEELIPPGSPRSAFSRIDFNNSRGKAEQVLQLLVSILSIKPNYDKFIAALPLTRIFLLLLGNHPTPAVGTQILKLLDISIGFSTSFTRKFELVSGWNVLKTVLPLSWDAEVNNAAFNLLMGCVEGSQHQKDGPTIKCPQIVPTILSALQNGLITVASSAHLLDDVDTPSIRLPVPASSPESGLQPVMSSTSHLTTIEALTEELLNLHSTVAQFRLIFQSQITTQLFVDGYKTFAKRLSQMPEINAGSMRVLEKLTHFGLALALDNAVAGSQKREIMDTVPIAEGILNPNTERTAIDPSLVADTRTVRQRIASARFSLQVGERTIIKIVARIGEWRKTIQASEKKRLRKSILDLRETRRQVSRLQEWTQLLTSERGLWPTHEARLWRLDETEGPNRTRKKLEPEIDKVPSSRADVGGYDARDVQAPQIEANQNTTEMPPWAESYEISSTEVDEPSLAEDVVDDKLRRVRHELESGDVIEAVATIARIAGVDSSPGLLIIGRTHLYMLDGVVENDDGEIIDAHDAPKQLLFVPGSIVELDGPQRARRWAHNQVAACSEKTFLLRDVALEVYFKDSRSLLMVFLDKKHRSEINHRLSNIINKNAAQHPSTPGLLRTPGPFSSRLSTGQSPRSLLGFRPDDLTTATRKWQAREISNFTYISILNQVSGRTPSDATQYPVFPWVLQDYTSETLDLMSPSSYRDLTKPMGALTPARREAAETRYENLESVDETPFHYGTHFSSSMIVCHFLIRLAPFTNMFKTLQGGDWDLPDRLFSDLGRAYESAARDVRGDVRELIPEFFTCPEFLENTANHDFGVQQSTGERIHDVKLPLWAKDDPLLFVSLHRRALESVYVSENLPAWIDLIWGHKQKDPASLNVFHPLSYEGAIDLDQIKDELEREATVGIIHNFGQTPRKLFTMPHPQRYNHGLPTLPLGTLHGIEEDPQLLTQGTRCFQDLGPTTPVRELLLDPSSDKVISCSQGSLTVPLYPHEQVEWNTERNEIRVLVDHKIVQVIENAACNCATFVDSDCLVTGWNDYTVRQWRLHRGNGPSSSHIVPLSNSSGKLFISLSHIMRIHTNEVVCVAASKTWSIIVSGSKDGSAAIWELNRGGYVRSIWHSRGSKESPSAINLVAINESTGYIATCSSTTLLLHTINARPIARLDLTILPSYYSPLVPSITALAFHEREYSHMGILGTGAPDGSITLWTWKHVEPTDWNQEGWTFAEVRRMKVRNLPNGRSPCITALTFSGERMYHGEETGKSFIWTLPDSD
ncbi:beach-domain-containing protein [Macrolepiota fuliginosa MF-IS2]|uniref:Beach-domain-containing protein n=1 Tax=Macrolepiota fuliginosa MF-IS2 TaxID=1400762 RepID=A0A9P5XFQ5_9AGAR|nr:beach-domain-containing protein [Macrolepiota fuliginosa MF-IS2]